MKFINFLFCILAINATSLPQLEAPQKTALESCKEKAKKVMDDVVNYGKMTLRCAADKINNLKSSIIKNLISLKNRGKETIEEKGFEFSDPAAGLRDNSGPLGELTPEKIEELKKKIRDVLAKLAADNAAQEKKNGTTGEETNVEETKASTEEEKKEL